MSEENFQSWVERLARDPHHAKPLANGEVVKSSAGEPFGAVQFVRIEKNHFVAEVGKRGSVYIYHFYPNEMYLTPPLHRFYDPMSEALLQIFKNPEQIEASFVEEMKSYAVKVTGWADNIWGDELAIRVVEVLDEKLKETHARAILR